MWWLTYQQIFKRIDQLCFRTVLHGILIDKLLSWKKGLVISLRFGFIWMTTPFSKCAVEVQIMNVTLRHFIQVSVPSQKRVNYHVCGCCACRFCLHFYLFLIAFWNCPDSDALNWFSYFLGKFQLELYFIIFGKLTVSLHCEDCLLSICWWFDLNLITFSDMSRLKISHNAENGVQFKI